jgi:DNA-binding transcriptional LysR family regulator
VRVAAAVGFGQTVLVPILARFLAELPDVRIELSLSDDGVRIVDAGFDLAIRMGAVEESEMVARRLARIQRKVVASPAYLAARGAPKSVAELSRHAALVSHAKRDTWRFDGRDGRALDVRVRWQLCAGDMMGLTEAARQGMGLAMLPAYIADPLIAKRELTEVDLGASPTTADVTALFPRAKTPPVAVRRLLDFVHTELSKSAWFASRSFRR